MNIAAFDNVSAMMEEEDQIAENFDNEVAQDIEELDEFVDDATEEILSEGSDDEEEIDLTPLGGEELFTDSDNFESDLDEADRMCLDIRNDINIYWHMIQAEYEQTAAAHRGVDYIRKNGIDAGFLAIFNPNHNSKDDFGIALPSSEDYGVKINTFNQYQLEYCAEAFTQRVMQGMAWIGKALLWIIRGLHGLWSLIMRGWHSVIATFASWMNLNKMEAYHRQAADQYAETRDNSMATQITNRLNGIQQKLNNYIAQAQTEIEQEAQNVVNTSTSLKQNGAKKATAKTNAKAAPAKKAPASAKAPIKTPAKAPAKAKVTKAPKAGNADWNMNAFLELGEDIFAGLENAQAQAPAAPQPQQVIQPQQAQPQQQQVNPEQKQSGLINSFLNKLPKGLSETKALISRIVTSITNIGSKAKTVISMGKEAIDIVKEQGAVQPGQQPQAQGQTPTQNTQQVQPQAQQTQQPAQPQPTAPVQNPNAQQQQATPQVNQQAGLNQEQVGIFKNILGTIVNFFKGLTGKLGNVQKSLPNTKDAQNLAAAADQSIQQPQQQQAAPQAQNQQSINDKLIIGPEDIRSGEPESW